MPILLNDPYTYQDHTDAPVTCTHVEISEIKINTHDRLMPTARLKMVYGTMVDGAFVRVDGTERTWVFRDKLAEEVQAFNPATGQVETTTVPADLQLTNIRSFMPVNASSQDAVTQLFIGVYTWAIATQGYQGTVE